MDKKIKNNKWKARITKPKGLMQGKFIAVAYTLRTHWNQFGKYPRRLKALNFDNFDNSHNSFLWPEYFIDFLCDRWILWQALTSVLCLHYRPETVHCSTKDVYTSEITILALHSWRNLKYFLIMLIF